MHAISENNTGAERLSSIHVAAKYTKIKERERNKIKYFNSFWRGTMRVVFGCSLRAIDTHLKAIVNQREATWASPCIERR
jgi:hypothetical protein